MSNASAPTANIAQRLKRLHALVEKRTQDEWGRSYVEAVLAQDSRSPEATCPRYAGVLEESGEGCVIVAESVDQLRYEMEALADADIPIVPVELVDLDSGEVRGAYRQSSVRFIGEERERELCALLPAVSAYHGSDGAVVVEIDTEAMGEELHDQRRGGVPYLRVYVNEALLSDESPASPLAGSALAAGREEPDPSAPIGRLVVERRRGG